MEAQRILEVRPRREVVQSSICLDFSKGKKFYYWLVVVKDADGHRLFKFPQMDFEMAIWEMTSLLIAPKKVFKSIYYHVRHHPYSFEAAYTNLVSET